MAADRNIEEPGFEMDGKKEISDNLIFILNGTDPEKTVHYHDTPLDFSDKEK